MADLNFAQGAIPVTLVNDVSGNQVAVSATGAASVDGSGVTQPVSAASLPLPAGAATAANQATEIASLAAIDAGIPAALGQTTMANSMPIVIASNQTSIPVTTEGQKPTYAAAFIGLVPAASPTDVLTITGSATKTVKITSLRVTVSTTAGSGILFNANLVKRSTADSAGTSTTATNVPYDSNSAAATATVKGYTANPTLGTAVGPVRAIRYAATPASVPNQEVFMEFGTRPAQTVVLRGTSEQLCLNFGGTSITGGIADISIEWTEE
jgi:hypothetical protein